jgi:hypothetical protein
MPHLEMRQGREDHLEVERKTALLSNAQRKAPL